jgi:hypothetical protein
MQNYVGEFFSKEWIMKNVLHFTDDEMKEMKKQIDDEKRSGEIEDEQDTNQPEDNRQ